MSSGQTNQIVQKQLVSVSLVAPFSDQLGTSSGFAEKQLGRVVIFVWANSTLVTLTAFVIDLIHYFCLG